MREPVEQRAGQPFGTEHRCPLVERRFIVLPMRPAGMEGWDEEKLAMLVRRDSMIGTGLPKNPDELA